MSELHISHRVSEPSGRRDAGPAVEKPSIAVNRASTRNSLSRFLFGFLIVATCALALWPFLPRRYEATSTIILRAADETGVQNHSAALRQLLDDGAVQSELDMIGSLPLSAEVTQRLGLGSDPEFKRAASTNLPTSSGVFSSLYASFVPPQPAPSIADAVREVHSHVIVNRDRRSYTVRLGYWSKDPVKAARMADMLATVYLDRQITHKKEILTRQSDALRSRVLMLASQLEALRIELDQPKVGLADTSPGGRLSILENERAAMTRDLDGARVKLADAIDRANSALPDAEFVSAAVPPLSPIFPNPVLMAIAAFLAASLAGLALAAPGFLAKNSPKSASVGGR